MVKTIIILLGLIIVAIATVMIFDARVIATKMFSSSETNETTKVLKIVGFVIGLIGLFIIYIAQKS